MFSRVVLSTVRRTSLRRFGQPKWVLPTRKYGSSATQFVPVDEQASFVSAGKPVKLRMTTEEEELEKIALQYHDALPEPIVPPDGWSSDWKNWSKLLTLFHTSPYFLQIPQIDMLVNIRYRIPGLISPLIYSNDEDHSSFIFSVDEDFHLYDFNHGRMHRVRNKDGTKVSEMFLVYFLQQQEISHFKLEEIPISVEGEAMILRILNRDPTVAAELGEDWLTFTPELTELEEELAHVDEKVERFASQPRQVEH